PSRGLADLIGPEVVVHRDNAERVSDERQLEQRHAPETESPRRPRAEKRDVARVVAEAALGEHRVEHVEIALEARRAPADDLSRAERQFAAEEQAVELVQLSAPVAGQPGRDAARPAEVAVVVRPDLVPLPVAE